MRKIKGFKLGIRPAEVKRRAKKAGLDLAALGFGEPELLKLCQQAAKAVHAGVLYDTFRHPDMDAPALSPIPGLAYSLILATLGPGFACAKESAAAESPDMRALWGILEEVALDETVRFVTQLLEEEAAKDSCVLSPLNLIQEPASLESALRKLEGSKLDLSLREGRIEPAPSVAVSASWLAQSKTRGKPKKE